MILEGVLLLVHTLDVLRMRPHPDALERKTDRSRSLPVLPAQRSFRIWIAEVFDRRRGDVRLLHEPANF